MYRGYRRILDAKHLVAVAVFDAACTPQARVAALLSRMKYHTHRMNKALGPSSDQLANREFEKDFKIFLDIGYCIGPNDGAEYDRRQKAKP